MCWRINGNAKIHVFKISRRTAAKMKCILTNETGHRRIYFSQAKTERKGSQIMSQKVGVILKFDDLAAILVIMQYFVCSVCLEYDMKVKHNIEYADNANGIELISKSFLPAIYYSLPRSVLPISFVQICFKPVSMYIIDTMYTTLHPVLSDVFRPNCQFKK